MDKYRQFLGFAKQHIDGPISGLKAGSEYVPGTQRLEFYADKLPEHNILIREFLPSKVDEDFGTATSQAGAAEGAGAYEFALVEKVLNPETSGLIALIGGIGSGKSTCVRKVGAIFDERKVDRGQQDSQFVIADCDAVFDNLEAGTAVSPNVEMLKAIRDTVLDYVLAISIGWDPDDVLACKPIAGRSINKLKSALISGLIAFEARGEDPSAMDLVDVDKVDRPLDLKRILNSQMGGRCQALNEASESEELQPYLGLAPTTELARDHAFNLELIRWSVDYIIRSTGGEGRRLVLVVDNVDHLPSESITKLVSDSLELIKKFYGRFTVVLPLRPSSITPGGYTEFPDYYYHYGPDCMDMLLRRIGKAVLLRSRAELEEVVCAGGGGPDDESVEEQVDALLVTSYVLSMMLLATGHVSNEDRPTEQELEPEICEEHDQLRRIVPDSKAILSVAETIMALTGTSARYTLALARRFYENTYTESEHLEALCRKLQGGDAEVRVKLSYSRTVEAILGGATPRGIIQDVYYAYRPALRGPHADQPSLAGIRVLKSLRDQRRCRVKDLVIEMQQWGIPRIATIATLNELAQKERLLVWFSSNRRLNGDDDRDLEQHVVISEHGLRYYSAVIGNFDYIWFSFSSLVLASERSFPRTFTQKARVYADQMRSLAVVESLQEFFYRHRAEYVNNNPDRVVGYDPLALHVLMSSLESLLEGALSTSKQLHGPQGDSARRQVLAAVNAVIELVLIQQDWYDKMMGSGAHLERYKQQIIGTAPVLDRLYNHKPMRSAQLRQLRKGWDLLVPFEEDEASPKDFSSMEQVVRRGIAGAVRFVPFAKDLYKLATGEVALEKERERYNAKKKDLVDAISHARTSFGLARQLLDSLFARLAALRGQAMKDPVGYKLLLDRIESEEAELANLANALADSEYTIPTVVSEDAIGKAKRKANQINRAYRAFMERSSHDAPGYLDDLWAIPERSANF